MTWTLFWDMHSGGGLKEEWAKIYIEAPQDEACVIFYNRFGHSPHRVSCTCCGEDYSVDSEESLEHITGYHRNCDYDEKKKRYVERADPTKARYGSRLVDLDNYLAQPDVLAIYAEEIKPEERLGTVPDQGYVWVN